MGNFAPASWRCHELLAGERRNATPTNDMTNKSTNNSEIRAEQAASKQLETIKLGLDVHAGSIVVVRILEHSAPQPAQKFAPGKFKEWVKTQLPLAPEVHSCYEAGPFGVVLHREVGKMGINNVVGQPACLDERPTRGKHDKSDV